jgi:hypothetical protein
LWNLLLVCRPYHNLFRSQSYSHCIFSYIQRWHCVPLWTYLKQMVHSLHFVESFYDSWIFRQLQFHKFFIKVFLNVWLNIRLIKHLVKKHIFYVALGWWNSSTLWNGKLYLVKSPRIGFYSTGAVQVWLQLSIFVRVLYSGECWCIHTVITSIKIWNKNMFRFQGGGCIKKSA